MQKHSILSMTAVVLVAALFVTTYVSTIRAKAAEPEDFVDYQADAWYAPAVEYVSGLDWMVGDDAHRLQPDREITRAEFAAVMARVFGAYKTADISAFKDVKPGAWYHDYMAMAVQEGLLEGVSETSLVPGGFVTREQAMTILARAMALPDGDEELLARFVDAKDVDGWAVPYVAAMVKEGRAKGYLNGTMMPRQQITRSETAQLLMNSIPHVAAGNITNARFTDNVLMSGGTLGGTYVVDNSQFEDMLLLAAGIGDGTVDFHDTDVARLVCWGAHDVYIYPGCRVEEIQVNRADGPCIIHWMGSKDDLPFVNFGEGSDPGCDIVDKDGERIPVIPEGDNPPLDEKPTTRPGSASRPVHYPTVYFDAMNGRGRTSQRIGEDGLIKPIDDPEREGYVFGGWYTDQACESRFSFTQEATDGMVLYARWYTPEEHEYVKDMDQAVAGTSVSISMDIDLLGVVGSDVLELDIENHEDSGSAVDIELVLASTGEVLGKLEGVEPGQRLTAMAMYRMPEYGNYETRLVVTPEDGGASFEVEAMLYVAYSWKR